MRTAAQPGEPRPARLGPKRAPRAGEGVGTFHEKYFEIKAIIGVRSDRFGMTPRRLRRPHRAYLVRELDQTDSEECLSVRYIWNEPKYPS